MCVLIRVKASRHSIVRVPSSLTVITFNYQVTAVPDRFSSTLVACDYLPSPSAISNAMPSLQPGKQSMQHRTWGHAHTLRFKRLIGDRTKITMMAHSLWTIDGTHVLLVDFLLHLLAVLLGYGLLVHLFYLSSFLILILIIKSFLLKSN